MAAVVFSEAIRLKQVDLEQDLTEAATYGKGHRGQGPAGVMIIRVLKPRLAMQSVGSKYTPLITEVDVQRQTDSFGLVPNTDAVY